MTLGQEFEAFAATLAGEVLALERIQNVLCETNMGATAIGTGLNAPDGLRREVHGAPREDHGLPDPPRRGPDRGDAGHAVLRPLLLLHEEPRDQALEGLQRPAAALLRARAAACARSTSRPSSPARRSCPGKVNPVIPEVVNMVCFRVIGSDLTVSMARRGRPAPAERLRAGHRRLHLRGADDVHQRGAHAARALRGRHHGQRGRLQALRRVPHRHGHGPEPGHRVRQVDRARRRGDEDGPGHPGADPREEGPDGGADREGLRPGRDDGSGRRGHEPPGARFARRCWRRPSALLVLPARGAAAGGRRLAAVHGDVDAVGAADASSDGGRAARLDRPPDGPARRSRAARGSAAGFSAR